VISSYVKKQLVAFAALAVAATLIITLGYAHLPTILGFGRMTVTAIFADGAGIYVNSNVTTRGVQIGKVTDVTIVPDGVHVAMAVQNDAKIPNDARAEIHSVSAVGEQYVEVHSNRASGPFLSDGAVIPLTRTTIPDQIAPVLDNATRFLASIPNDGLQAFLDEGYNAFQNLGPDLRALLNSSQNLIDTADRHYPQTAEFIDNVGPLLDTQNRAGSDVRSFWRDLAGFTNVLRTGDGHFRSGIRTVHKGADAATRFLHDNENSAPVLTYSLERIGKLLTVYRPAVEQLLVIYPITYAREQRALMGPNRGLRASIALGKYPSCTDGFQPQDMRNLNDISDREAVQGEYCNVPHDDPRAVRGSRNVPCLEGKIGMRSATIDECLGRKPNQDAGTSPRVGLITPSPDGPERTPFDSPDNQTGFHPSRPHDPLQDIGIVGSSGSKKEQTWQSMLTAPLDR
jgi:phospholipid/cholesterol/gamma-HCH transport system substrate-binding protein